MVQELMPLLPKEVGTLALAIAMSGTLVGAGLWLVGSRFSRSLITLVLVSIGAWIGLLLPGWVAWKIDGWAPAVGLALVLGASGFFLHRFWVGVGLGVVLAAWAALGVWIVCRGADAGALPRYAIGTKTMDYMKDLWASLPVDVRKFLPFACGATMLTGLIASLRWPRFGVVMLYSSAGVSLVIAMGLSAMSYARPQWVGALPAKGSSQAMTVLAMVAFGALLQWRIGPSKKMPKPRQGRPLVIDD